jgi:hypothetical protein
VWPWRGIACTATTAVASCLLWLVPSCPLIPLALAVELTTKQISEGEPGGGDLVAAAMLGLLGAGLLALAGPRLALAVAGVERWRCSWPMTPRRHRDAAATSTPIRPPGARWRTCFF